MILNEPVQVLNWSVPEDSHLTTVRRHSHFSDKAAWLRAGGTVTGQDTTGTVKVCRPRTCT